MALGIDVGGTKIAGGLVEIDTGTIRHLVVRPTPLSQGGRAVLDCVASVAGDLAAGAAAMGLQTVGLGVGVPELVDRAGRVTTAWNFDWLTLDPEGVLAGLGPLRIESDVRAGAYAEMRFGRGRDFASFAYVTIGSGMSYTLCEDGHVRRGARGYAIHFASNELVVAPDGARATGRFLLEGFASGFGMVDTLRRRTELPADARAIVEGRAGPAGEVLLEQATLATASYLGQLVNMLDPQAIVLAGGLGTAPAYADRVRSRIPEFIFAPDARDLPVVPSALGVHAGVIGAAAIIEEERVP